MWCHLASNEARIDRAHNMVNQNVMITQGLAHPFQAFRASLIARFMGPTWGPSGADRTQLGPMLAPWTLLSGMTNNSNLHNVGLFRLNNWMLSLISFTSHNCSWMICIDPFRKGYLSTLSWWTNYWGFLISLMKLFSLKPFIENLICCCWVLRLLWWKKHWFKLDGFEMERCYFISKWQPTRN